LIEFSSEILKISRFNWEVLPVEIFEKPIFDILEGRLKTDLGEENQFDLISVVLLQTLIFFVSKIQFFLFSLARFVLKY